MQSATFLAFSVSEHFHRTPSRAEPRTAEMILRTRNAVLLRSTDGPLRGVKASHAGGAKHSVNLFRRILHKGVVELRRA